MRTIQKIVNHIFTSYTYILPFEDKSCWLIDCGDIEKVLVQGWNVKGVLLTHAHYDHIYGLNKLLAAVPEALVYTNRAGEIALQNPKWNFSRYHVEDPNFIFEYPDAVRVIESECDLCLDSSLNISVLFTPGHEPSCLSFMLDDLLFTGDAYIPGIKTITSFPRSNKNDATASLNRLKELESLGYHVCSGHCAKP